MALIKRYDVLMQSLDAIKGYTEHEEKLMLNLIKARNGMSTAQTQAVLDNQEQVLRNVRIIGEAYPRLYSSELYQNLQAQITETNEHLAASKRLYHANVSLYNQAIAVFPASVIAGMTGNRPAEVKNALKKRSLYLLAFAFFPAFNGIIGGFEEVIFRLLHINPYGAAPMMIRYISAFLGTIVAIRFIAKLRGQGREARAAYNEKIMAKAVQEVMPGAELRPDDCLDGMDLYLRGVVPDFDDFQGSCLIRYKKDGKACAFSNLTLTRRVKDHNDRYYDKAVFAGQAYVLRYKSRMQGSVRVMTTTRWMGKESSDGFKKQDQGREEKIETENQVFNEQFDVYATDAHSAFYVVTPVVMERLLAMKAKYGSFGLSVRGDEIAIALSSGYYLFEPPESYQEIENISVEKSADEIRRMLLFAHLLEDTVNGRQTAGEPS